MRLRLIDSDGDTIDANGKSEWENFTACLEDVKEAFRESDLPLNYMPFRFIDWDSDPDPANMKVYGKITDFDITVKYQRIHIVRK